MNTKNTNNNELPESLQCSHPVCVGWAMTGWKRGQDREAIKTSDNGNWLASWWKLNYFRSRCCNFPNSFFKSNIWAGPARDVDVFWCLIVRTASDIWTYADGVVVAWAFCRRKSDLMSAVMTVPMTRKPAIRRFAWMSPNVSKISEYNIVKRMPKTCAPAFRIPEDVPSGSG